MRKTHNLGIELSRASKKAPICAPKELQPTYNAIHEFQPISLFSAAAAGNIAMLERLRTNGTDMFSIADDGSSALHAAARAGSVQATVYLLSLGLPPDRRNERGRMPVHEAALAGSWETIEILMRGADESDDTNFHPGDVGRYLIESENIDAITAFIHQHGQHIIDQGRQSLLHTAAMLKSAAVMSLLLSYEGLDINQRDFKERSALHIAVMNGCSEVLRLLLAQPSIDVNALKYVERPLDIAIRLGHEEVVRILLAQETVQFRGDSSWPKIEIIQSTRYRHYRVGQILLQNERTQQSNEICPLLQAIAVGNEAKAMNLICEDVSVLGAHRGGAWRNPLNWAIALGYNTLAKRLMDSPVTNINVGSESNFLPIEIAAGKGDQTILQLLLDHPRVWQGEGRPLYEAVKHNHLLTVELLLSYPKINHNKSEPLVEAARQGNLDIVNVLLGSNKTDVNQSQIQRGPRYETALSIAVRRRDLEMTLSLLRHEPKIDVNATNGSYHTYTALDIAISKNATNFVEILRSYGAKTAAELETSYS
ncbi:hypothetical protein SLS60_002997 [Paraconiothyrium brasiliense]|uniref:Ankyrin repeat protein n=1 Tax=Paraconiothyrium brasiliense TaxID=300254 RepID=A0ABR3RUV5_9PLEO